MPLRNILLLVVVFATAPFIFTSCSENRGPSSSPSSSSNAPDSLPVLSLQRVFEQVAIVKPVLMLQAPNDDSKWYIVEKGGRILQVSNNGAQSSTFLDISERVDSGPNEAGLLGMAFHPQYASNGSVYLSYTTSDPSLTSIISRVTRSVDGSSLQADSEEILLRVSQPYSNHNGGHIAFGPDGFLYIGFGDGGSGGDPQGHGQNTQTLLGSLLRIDVNSGTPYAIPATNPFASGEQGRPEIYAWGLRNPWRWSFDKTTGLLWAADVGQNSWEEVSIISAPGNYGWNGKEGTHCYESTSCNNPAFIDPVIEYSHEDGCSITGGYVYRGSAIPSLQGTYLYSDYCSGTLWGAKDKGDGSYESAQLLSTGLNVSSFAEGNDGEIYIIHLGGEIHQLVSR
ncbi:PQQ-dependent sugar dehydrogenase [Kaarinaea lacus]